MIVAVIPARGGSKGIPRKNIIDVCGQPLIGWSIDQALRSESIDEVYVTSDSDEILKVAGDLGAKQIKRPAEISGDEATSESAWLHALDVIEKQENKTVEYMVCMQATSPVRSPVDLDRALFKMKQEGLDSLFSATNIGDFLIWRKNNETYESVNYDFKNRKRRQEFGGQLLENGSFYICKPSFLRKYSNRLSGKIGVYAMDKWKSFEIDEEEDLFFVSMIIKNYLLGGGPK